MFSAAGQPIWLPTPGTASSSRRRPAWRGLRLFAGPSNACSPTLFADAGSRHRTCIRKESGTWQSRPRPLGHARAGVSKTAAEIERFAENRARLGVPACFDQGLAQKMARLCLTPGERAFRVSRALEGVAGR